MTTTATSNIYHFHHRDEPTKPPTLHHRRVSLIKRPPLVRSPAATQQQSLRRMSSNNNIKINTKPKKSVRFCDNESLENVRLFLKTQMPKACKSDPSCAKNYSYRLRKANWPVDVQHNKSSRIGSAIRIEDIQLDKNDSNNSDDTITLIGTCQVANLAFEKHIVIRYSFDEWTTMHELDAQYKEPIASSANTWDRFQFQITVNSHLGAAHETLYLAAKYTVAGREFWDNNDNKNYQVDILSEVQLDFQHEETNSSSSSSDEEDDEHNTFDDCVENDIDDEDLVQQLKPLTLSNTKTSFGNRYDFDTAIDKPWTPPLSPTTPVDQPSLLWTNNKEYFNSKPPQQKKPIISSTSPVSPTEYYRYYSNKPTYFSHH